MLLAPRLLERLSAVEISQAELGRRVGISQQAVGKLVKGSSRSTSHIARIARELRTTAAYLEGETDDPSEGAVPPPPAPQYQAVTMQVLLPSEAALTRMFQGLIASMPDVSGDELARELAMLLPTGLEQLRGRLREVASIEDEPLHEAPADHASVDRASRRAQRT